MLHEQQPQTKPLITVPADYVPSSESIQQSQYGKSSIENKPGDNNLDRLDNNDIIKKMIAEEIQAFDMLLKNQIFRSKKLSIQIGTKEEMSIAAKQLNELQDIIDQATESTDALTLEIQTLSLTLNEAFSMAAEAKSKHAIYNNLE